MNPRGCIDRDGRWDISEPHAWTLVGYAAGRELLVCIACGKRGTKRKPFPSPASPASPASRLTTRNARRNL